MRNFIERIKIHLWYDWRIIKAKRDLMKASIEFNNNGEWKSNELRYYFCRAYLYDLCYHKKVYLEEFS